MDEYIRGLLENYNTDAPLKGKPILDNAKSLYMLFSSIDDKYVLRTYHYSISKDFNSVIILNNISHYTIAIVVKLEYLLNLNKPTLDYILDNAIFYEKLVLSHEDLQACLNSLINIALKGGQNEI